MLQSNLFYWLTDADIRLLRWFQHGRIEALDPLLNVLSYTTTHLAIAIVVFVAILFFRKQAFISKNSFLSFNALFFACIITSTILKYTILRPRPYLSYPDILHLYNTTTSSFPSGHTITAFSLAAGLVFLKANRYLIFAAFLWALTVAYSRLALGSHYPSDVLASISLVCIYAAIISKTFKNKPAGKPA